MNHSFLLDTKTVTEAYASIEGSIHAILKLERSWRDALHVVVLDPRAKFGAVEFEDAILFETSINLDTADIDLKTLARKKALVSWEHGLDSHVVQQSRPYLYQEGDNKYAGAVVHHGLVVATAGTQWYFDELFSVWMAAACRALAIEKMEKILTNDKQHFVE